jgi:chromosomal replication initiation ATPase DnaA
MKYHKFNAYAKEVSKVFGIEEDFIFSKNKTREVVDARYLLYYLCKTNKIQIITIKKYMKNRGYDIPYSTIHYGVKRVIKKVDDDRDYQLHISRINQECA